MPLTDASNRYANHVPPRDVDTGDVNLFSKSLGDMIPENEGARWLPTMMNTATPADSEVHLERALLAYVNEGRWVVDCPCSSAQLACRTDPRFFCYECGNSWADGKWATVIWPAEQDEIERLLLQRPDPRTRNWEPQESSFDLAVENYDHGVGE